MDDERYWIVDSDNDFNLIRSASDAIGYPVVGLVDEKAGGIIGYLGFAIAHDICKALNRHSAQEFIP